MGRYALRQVRTELRGRRNHRRDRSLVAQVSPALCDASEAGAILVHMSVNGEVVRIDRTIRVRPHYHLVSPAPWLHSMFLLSWPIAKPQYRTRRGRARVRPRCRWQEARSAAIEGAGAGPWPTP